MADNVEPVLLTDEVRELLALIKNSDISEVLIERGDAKLHIKRAVATAVAAVPIAAVQPLAAPSAAVAVAPVMPEWEPEPLPVGVTVSAPMVGTYFGAPSPKDPQYVQLGDEVKPGDVLGIIEAMKIMNEIECEIHGRIAHIMVQNAQPVEYGQPLMVIEPI